MVCALAVYSSLHCVCLGAAVCAAVVLHCVVLATLAEMENVGAAVAGYW